MSMCSEEGIQITQNGNEIEASGKETCGNVWNMMSGSCEDKCDRRNKI
jgi:hypothetical protein